MREIILERPSLAVILNEIEKLAAVNFLAPLFRGQANSTWPIVPSLFRIDINSNPVLSALMGSSHSKRDRYDRVEQQLVQKFFSEGLPYLPAIERSVINDRIVAQHFGVPTSLLDWSRDPFVALFFALEHWNNSDDACLFVLTPTPVPLSSNKLPRDWSNSYTTIEPPAIDRRIPAQKSVLTWHEYGDPNAAFVPVDDRERLDHALREETERPAASLKLVIPNDLKKPLFLALQRIGIDRRSLFPNLDGVGAYVQAWARSSEWS